MTNQNGPEKRATNIPASTKPKITTTPPIYNRPPEKKGSTKAFIPIVLVLGLLMLGFIGYQAYQNSATNRTLEAKIAQLEEADELRIELEYQYNESLTELEEMRGLNEELNTLIDEQKAELKTQKTKVSKMIRQKRDLANVRSELAEFKAQSDALVAQVESLLSENEALAAKNEALELDNSLLKEDLNGKIAENGALDQARAMLVSEKKVLTKKVNIASVINVKNVKVEGFKMRGDKPIKKKNAKTIDQLKVCFTTILNEVTQPGLEKFYIRIVNPIGETMAVEELGSGKIVDKKTGGQVPFTQVKEYDYVNDEAELCFIWEPNMSFQRGNYQVEVYNKGHKSGAGTFSLK
ncbi:MAG: hypothetical protein ACI9XO_002023 [Paraglaciecola sp.]|jgi:hypothetical protein